MITTFSDLFVRIGLSYLLAGTLGFYALALSQVIGWVVGCVLAYIFYKRYRSVYPI